MTVETYPDQVEPENQGAAIWRFMNLKKFRDLVMTEELYFCRADLFLDQSEGLPPQEFRPFPNLNPLELHDRHELDSYIGGLAEFRESFYVNCWHLFREETAKMWNEYGEDGVAICSQYRLLKSALDGMDDRACLGLVRYGTKHMKGWNLFRFIFNKRMEYAEEHEVRALLWIMPRPPDIVLDGQRRKVDLRALVTEIVVTPWASSSTLEEIIRFVSNSGHAIPVRPSTLTRYRQFLPSR